MLSIKSILVFFRFWPDRFSHYDGDCLSVWNDAVVVLEDAAAEEQDRSEADVVLTPNLKSS